MNRKAFKKRLTFAASSESVSNQPNSLVGPSQLKVSPYFCLLHPNKGFSIGNNATFLVREARYKSFFFRNIFFSMFDLEWIAYRERPYMTKRSIGIAAEKLVQMSITNFNHETSLIYSRSHCALEVNLARASAVQSAGITFHM